MNYYPHEELQYYALQDISHSQYIRVFIASETSKPSYLHKDANIVAQLS